VPLTTAIAAFLLPPLKTEPAYTRSTSG